MTDVIFGGMRFEQWKPKKFRPMTTIVVHPFPNKARGCVRHLPKEDGDLGLIVWVTHVNECKGEIVT